MTGTIYFMDPRSIPRDRKYIKDRIEIDANGCWVWQLALKKGYGVATRHGGVYEAAYRLSYEIFVGPIPPGRSVDHLCFNRSCVNPGHLDVVTPGENSRRMHAAGRGWNGAPAIKICGKCQGPRDHVTKYSGKTHHRCQPCYLKYQREYRERMRKGED